MTGVQTCALPISHQSDRSEQAPQTFRPQGSCEGGEPLPPGHDQGLPLLRQPQQQRGPGLKLGRACGPPCLEPGVLWVGVAEGLPPPASTQFPAQASPTHEPCRLPGCLALPAAPQEAAPAWAHEGPRGLVCTCFRMFIHFFTPRRFWSYTQGPMVPSWEGRHWGESCRQVEWGDQRLPRGGVGPGRELGQVGCEGEMDGGRGAWGMAPGGQTHLAWSRDFWRFITDPGTPTASPTRGTSARAAGLWSTPRPPLS